MIDKNIVIFDFCLICSYILYGVFIGDKLKYYSDVLQLLSKISIKLQHFYQFY